MKRLLLLLLVGLSVVVRGGQYGESFQHYALGAVQFTPATGELFSNQLGTTAKISELNMRELQLVADGVAATRTAFRLPDLDPGESITAFSAKWNAQIYSEVPWMADGLSFNFGPLGNFTAAALTGGTYSQEDGFGSGITVSVRTYTGNAPGYYVRANGNTVPGGFVAKPSEAWGNLNPARHFFEVDWGQTAGLTLRVDGVPIFTGLPTPGFTPASGDRFVFGARTGGADHEVRLDNIVIVTGGQLQLQTLPGAFQFSGENPPNETAAKAFDGDANTKWLTFASSGHIGAGFPSLRTLRAYTLTSANDFPGRDLKSWEFQTLDHTLTWTNRGAQSEERFHGRYERRAFLVPHPGAGLNFRAGSTANDGAGETQLAEFQTYALTGAPPVAQLVVTNANDSGGGSLRNAVGTADSVPGPAVITFDASLSGATLAPASTITVKDPDGVTIDATSLTRGLTITGSDARRIFLNLTDSRLALRRVQLTDGRVTTDPTYWPAGAAVYNLGSLDLTECDLRGHDAPFAAAIYTAGGRLLATGCSFSGNTATSAAGAILNESGGTASLTNCTFFGNTSNVAGAVSNYQAAMSLAHCTLSGNSATGVGGMGGGLRSSDGPLTLSNCIIAGNSAPSAPDISSPDASITATGVSVIGDPAGSGLAASPNVITGNARLAPFAPWGGPTWTMPPLPDSPAIDVASYTEQLTDQHGAARGAFLWTCDFSRGLNDAVLLRNSGPLDGSTGVIDGGSFILTPNVANQTSTLILPAPGPFTSFTATFDFMFTGANPGDGISFSVGPRPSGPVGVSGIEDGYRLRIETDGVVETESSLWSGTTGSWRHVSPVFDRTADGGRWHRMGITLSADGEIGIILNGVYLGAHPCDYTYTPGDCFCIGGSTSTVTAGHHVDNICIVTDPVRTMPDAGAVEADAGLPDYVPLVDSTSDTLDGITPGGTSLREALLAAPRGSIVTFSPQLFNGEPGDTIFLDSELVITKNIAVDGGGSRVTLNGSDATRLLRTGGEATVTLNRLNFTGGRADNDNDGGAILSHNCILSLMNCTLTGNAARHGGAIQSSDGRLSLFECLLAGNSASEKGGAISSGGEPFHLVRCTFFGNSAINGGAISYIDDFYFSGGTLSQCTLTGNQAETRGGAVYFFGKLTFNHTSVSGNTAGTEGGGVYTGDEDLCILLNSVVAGNAAAQWPDIGVFNERQLSIRITGVNFIGNLSGSGLTAGPGLLTGDPRLAPIGNYGGPTPTMPPLPASPVLDAATVVPEFTTDQRGAPLPVSGRDVGAVELGQITVTTAADENNGIGTGGVSLREAIGHNAPFSAELIRMAPALNGQTIHLTTQIEVAKPVAFVDASPLSAGITVHGGGVTRLFHVQPERGFALHGFTLTGGRLGGWPENGAAILNNDGIVILTECSLAGNTAGNGNGGAINNGGRLHLFHCRFSDNSAGNGGAVHSRGTLRVEHSTFTSNLADDGGAVDNDNGSMNAEDCLFSGNSAEEFGGAITSSGEDATVTLKRCTLLANTAIYGGGALDTLGAASLDRCSLSENHSMNDGGAVLNIGNLILSHSTLSGNIAGDEGGAIVNWNDLVLNHCTISMNFAGGAGGGITAEDGDDHTSLTNSIIAGNSAGSRRDFDQQSSTLTLTGVNLIGNLAGSGLTAGPGLLTGDARLAPLGNYGGPTPTMALRPGSPARNAAAGSTITSDQRGFPIVGVPDLGAYEAGTTAAQNCLAHLAETASFSLPAAMVGPQGDYDGDGVSNEAECLAGTDPWGAGSTLFRITGIVRNGNNLVLSFPTVTGRNYTLWRSENLTGPWTNSGLSPLAGNNTVRSFTVPAPVAGVPRRFFRVQEGP